MDNTELYREYNYMPRRDAEMTLKQFVPRLTWSKYENILDVGCGPGDITAKILRPQLPPSASIVGVDINPKMVEFANKHYLSESLHFIQLDFSTKSYTNVFQDEQFTKIFSFYCFHWIKNIEQAVTNVHSLLKPGGEFLITTLPSYKLFRVYRILSKMDEWKTYMEDVENYIPCFHDSTNICEEIRQFLTEQGLDAVVCKEQNTSFSYPNIQTCLRLYESVNPFVKRMSKQTREQYMECFEKLMKEHGVITESESGKILIHYPILTLYGKRPVTSE